MDFINIPVTRGRQTVLLKDARFDTGLSESGFIGGCGQDVMDHMLNSLRRR